MTTQFNRLDLNLLRVFHAIMEERSVLRAAQRICLSQSAVSHALARLREMLDDELFVRTASGMQPTARALVMAPLIRQAWKSLEAAIGLPRFEPAKSATRFTIAVNDFVTAVMAPDLLRLLRQEAPFVDLVIRPDARIDLTEQIDRGQIDAAIGTFSDVPARFQSSSLFAYDDVLIAHSSRKLGRLSLESLSRLSLAAVSLHGEHEGLVNGFVSERGLTRRSDMYDRAALEQAFTGSQQAPRMAISLSHFLALPALLEDSELAAIVPRPLASSLASIHPLSTYELPYKTGLMDVGVLWHERNTNDAPQQWLREMLRRATGSLRASPVRFPSTLICSSPSAASIARFATLVSSPANEALEI
ncbi:LysR family transcriptional regulator [Bradyrhizobium sp. Leo121]|uniref:LysR family transcriptional regulator n=1 Tax=Bradyrhizobium sp. Leo121 TaxID=1571195 RepID=UPI00102896B4|nr:LysR family transcriptional regulator [Bradyrhizobium sp. Leo121]RZN33723.1 LysR family transcriptional regulator [Bradyrhizobium sp. Leo121]